MKSGIIGTGFIIREALTAMSEVPEIALRAIFARPGSVQKGQAFAEEFGIEKVYTDYDELLRDPEIDTVYIANINLVHYEYGKKALLAGRDVIMEKPFVTLAAHAQELADLAESRGLFIFEAVTTLFMPNYTACRELLAQLGELRSVRISYGQYSSKLDDYKKGIISSSLDPARKGGALNDMGIYCIHVAADLFGSFT